MSDIADVGSYLPVAAQAVTNVSLHTVFGNNDTVGTTYELITNLDATPTQLGTSGDGIEVVGGSTDDDGSPTGTGAQTVKVKGLDTSFNIKEASMTLDGTTIVEQGDTTWTFINEAYITATGTGLASAGTLTFSNDAAGNNIGLIEAGDYGIRNCWWKVPAGHTGYVHGFWYSVLPVAAPVAQAGFALQIARHGFQGVASSETYETIAEVFVDEGDAGVAVNEARGGNGTGWFSFPGNVPIVIPPKAIVRLAAKAMSTGVAVTGGFNIMVQGSGSGTTVTES
jgi:hypothetical protein